MKKIITFSLAVLFVINVFGQNHIHWSNDLSNTELTTGSVSTWGDCQVTQTNGKIPIVTSPAVEGNAIKLEWTMPTGGGFNFYLPNSNPDLAWIASDVSSHIYLKMSLYADSEIPATDLIVYLAGGWDGNDTYKSGFLQPILYLEEEFLPIKQWTDVYVTLSDFYMVANNDYNPARRFSTADMAALVMVNFRAENPTGSGTYRTLYIDNIEFTSEKTTSIKRNLAEKINVQYQDGQLITSSEFNGLIDIFDVSGKQVLNGLRAENGRASVKLDKGLYVIKTEIGNGKLIVR